jgi:hypothetical protein
VPVAALDNVNVVPDIAEIVVPLGNFGCDTYMPTARPVIQ